MKKSLLIVGVLSLVMISCKKKKVENLETDFRETYANIALASYEDSYDLAVELQTKIYDFVDNPTESGFAGLKQAWLDARDPYGQTEVFRFADGPIDDEDGPEGLLNAWPLDEGYIDYVDGNTTSGLINDLTFVLNADNIEAKNEEGGEENVSVGYHAIEFLLWGQDDANTALKTPGDRPYTDYLTVGGTAANQARRGEYLKICSDLLVQHLGELVDEWKEGGAYRTTFLEQDIETSISDILTGMGVLGKSELAGERVYTALDNQDQEDEHSCFSDNTKQDIYLNFLGIKNLYYGSYTRIDGTVVSGISFYDVMKKADKKLNETLEEYFTAAEASIESIEEPFDYALTLETPGGDGPINNTVTDLRAMGDKIAEAGTELDLTIDTSLPE